MSEVRRPRAVLSVALALFVLVAIVVGGLAIAGDGGDDEGTTATPTTTPATSRARSESAGPPSLGALPPAFVQCLADQGVDVESITSESLVDVIHSPSGSACFGVLHQGGGAP
jgi:hypothetical protein